MGLGIFGSSFSSYEKRGVPMDAPVLPNPNPKNYVILDYVQIGRALVLKVKYPDCTNYEGVKILLYGNTTIKDIKEQGSIDPHFCQNEMFKSPVARFEPTEKGWVVATTVARQFYS